MMGDMMQDMSLDVELYNQFDMSGSWVGLKKTRNDCQFIATCVTMMTKYDQPDLRVCLFDKPMALF
jgi:hypothetical protein